MVGERVAPRRVAETVSERLVAVLGVPESGVGGHEVDPEPSPRLRARPIPAAAVPEPPVVDAGAAGGHVEPLDHQRRLRRGDPLAARRVVQQRRRVAAIEELLGRAHPAVAPRVRTLDVLQPVWS